MQQLHDSQHRKIQNLQKKKYIVKIQKAELIRNLNKLGEKGESKFESTSGKTWNLSCGNAEKFLPCEKVAGF